MRAFCLLPLPFLLLVFASPANGQVAGYRRVPETVLPESLAENRLDGRFRIAISRRAADSLRLDLIKHAESLLPPSSLIRAAAVRFALPAQASALAEAESGLGDRWWWHKVDEVLVPFAVTGTAVSYYIERVRQLSHEPNPYASSNPGVPHRAAFSYTAWVDRSPWDFAGWAVHLRAEFNLSCGSLCGMGFSHERVVHFDSKGRLLRVHGDAPPEVEVN